MCILCIYVIRTKNGVSIGWLEKEILILEIEYFNRYSKNFFRRDSFGVTYLHNTLEVLWLSSSQTHITK